jgi:hypothetical protein
MLYLTQVTLVTLLTLAASAQQSQPQQGLPQEETMARINFLIIKDSNGKPVKNAEVVLHQVGKDGKQKQEGLELKTHDDGKAEATGIPYGKIRVQVIARGFRTFGEDYDIAKPTHEITIKLQKPAEQYSIYK